MLHPGVTIIRDTNRTSRLRFCDAICYTTHAERLSRGEVVEGFDVTVAAEGCCSNCGAYVPTRQERREGHDKFGVCSALGEVEFLARNFTNAAMLAELLGDCGIKVNVQYPGGAA